AEAAQNCVRRVASHRLAIVIPGRIAGGTGAWAGVGRPPPRPAGSDRTPRRQPILIPRTNGTRAPAIPTCLSREEMCRADPLRVVRIGAQDHRLRKHAPCVRPTAAPDAPARPVGPSLLDSVVWPDRREAAKGGGGP